ncbi:MULTISPECIES: glycoside hydrolase family 104 protein [unclassified Paraburkholderia]|uniref:glycoside hydrolase family 24 protein n=1 Tax=unclassified Paraburkholderia TaxID=2615204 RepID=UPI001621A73C|nr:MULTISPECIES: glycoside hydrolase family 104 protein [unclassified Paraburkholderia]MBB5444261.1 muramidase (phage lysozyme) [Paraburkholderia sp. WSM4177]MBB5484624.1 muramidase (phage lysozyme) [Paraburkholderia sp. WSM4180]
MTSKSVPHNPQTPPPPGLKQPAFAFPFLHKAQGNAGAPARFTDEHEIYRLLALNEPSGSYLVSRKGIWNGGIHVTDAGAGQALDLDAGLRCIADGVLVTYRADSDYPISEVSVDGSNVPLRAPYSTGFALVRHEMEFPRGSKLTFYSLYMHLMSNADYDSHFPKRQKPAYWSRRWRVTQYAQDRPSPRAGQTVDPLQVGLHVRKTPNGAVLGILPQGVSVTVGKTATVHGAPWGQLTDLNGATLYPPETGGYVAPSVATSGWIYLGAQNGGPVAKESLPDSTFDRIVVAMNQTCSPGDPQGTGGGISVKAGDLIGHLGRYDSLNQGTSGTRMAHIEVFCDDSIRSFLEQGRAWVNRHGPHKEDWAALGLSSEPTILRIAPGTVLYQRTRDNQFVPGANLQSRKTDAVQVYSLAELARNPNRRIPEPHPHPDPGYPVNWWHVDGVSAQGQPIDGWVCDFNHASGRVTLELSQKWIDFECLSDAHDPAHTIFATTQQWVDYASGANVADLASRSNLSPLMLKVYDALFRKGDGKQAADELCTLSQIERGGYPWLMQAASRLIVKHESEWAKPGKWKQLIAELEKQTGPKPQHQEEQKRIDKLVWWDEVAAKVPGFPGSDIYHINPIALISNFMGAIRGRLTLEEARIRAFLRMIPVGEGTQTPTGYERLFGGQSFIRDYGKDFDDHPRIVITKANKKTGKSYSSSAAGAYQVMGYNWDDPTYVAYRKQYEINDFSPISQDRYCVILLRHKRHALSDIKNGDVKKAIFADHCNLEWASLPGDQYGQGGVGMDTVNAKFTEYLKDELAGKSDLAVPIGGLDDLIK